MLRDRFFLNVVAPVFDFEERIFRDFLENHFPQFELVFEQHLYALAHLQSHPEIGFKHQILLLLYL